jgi:tRNA dimethylallyltransferase
MIVIAGPTAAGKSARAIQIARAAPGRYELISADSRHVYRSMNIGSNKPDVVERAVLPHHLLDLREPHEPFSLAEYTTLARTAIADIQARGKTPMLVGGTGQYIRALLEGWQAPEVPPDPAIRARWEAYAQTHGGPALYAELTGRDPDAAATIDSRNIRRVIRALEVIEATGQAWSAQQRRNPVDIPIEWVYVNLPREQLYTVADARIQHMLDMGWLDETQQLLNMLAAHNINPDQALKLPAISALGYRELIDVILGRRTLPDAITAIRHATHRFIRMQDTWFRKLDGMFSGRP